jgi:ketosteroid isomerase-like protein
VKRIGFLAVACGLLTAGAQPAQAQDTDAAAFAPMHQFADGMNAGDFKKAADAYAPSADIIDEFAPHHWTSFADWAKDAAGFFKAGGVTGLHIALSAPSNKEVAANYAYAVVPTTLTYLTNGKPTVEKGLFTFSMAKSADGWRITGWAWSTL